jgi:osmoprotectant transport system substrate-binding protein
MKNGFVQALALIAAGAAVGLASPADAQTIRVGSKNFTEQFILGEMYAAALEGAGFKVERKINLGGTLIAHKALTSNEVDLYPEYTGTALNAVLKAPVISDPDKVYQQVKAFYEKEYQVTWLKPSGINNGYAMLVRPDTAAQYNLKTLSDLGKVAKQLKIGAGPEFADRKDGLPGLKETYGAEFGEFKQFGALALRYDALTAKQVDVANGFATDWQISAGKFISLADDKGLFPPYYLAPAVRQAALNPKVEEAANKVSALLNNEIMRTLNAEVEVKKEEPRDVAKAFLKSKGVIK